MKSKEGIKEKQKINKKKKVLTRKKKSWQNGMNLRLTSWVCLVKDALLK